MGGEKASQCFDIISCFFHHLFLFYSLAIHVSCPRVFLIHFMYHEHFVYWMCWKYFSPSLTFYHYGFFFLNIQSFIFLGVESLNLFLYSCWVFTSWGSLPHSISLKALLSEIILENTDSNICNTHNVLCSLYKNQTFNFGKTDLIWTIIFSSYNK